MSHFDPHTNYCELEIQRIIHLKILANQLPYAFIDTKKVTKSHIPTVNTPTRIDASERQLTNESKIRLKRGRPIGSKDIRLKCGRPISSKDITPRKRRAQMIIDTLEVVHYKQKALIEAYGKQKASEVV